MEGVGEVVFVEDCGGAVEEGLEEGLGLGEGFDGVCGGFVVDAFEDCFAVVLSDDDGDVGRAGDVCAEVSVELVLLRSEFDHSGCDDDAR